jgi:hypothetical protein
MMQTTLQQSNVNSPPSLRLTAAAIGAARKSGTTAAHGWQPMLAIWQSHPLISKEIW